MKLTSGIKLAKELMSIDEKALQIAILEAYQTYNNNFSEGKIGYTTDFDKKFHGYCYAMKKTSKIDLFLCGLLFSEFYAENEEYGIAQEKQEVYLKMLGIKNRQKFMYDIHEMANWESKKYFKEVI